jgi:4-amino-4-deoxy-L-arabinose transferase-like glycosyltransferase
VRPATVRALLGLILLGYFGLAIGYALATPRWNNPDEPAHFNYIREIADSGRLPVIASGDWDAELLERLKPARFPDDAAIREIRYEAHQPPLYYLLAAPLYRLSGAFGLSAQILALKGLSVVLGALVIVATFVAACQIFSDRPAIAVLAAATAAFIPMHTAISAAINNDSLANALAAVTVAVLAFGLRRGFDDRATVALGLLLGALLLTKLTVYLYVPLAVGALLWAERQRLHAHKPVSPMTVWRRPLLALAVAAAVAAWWFVRNALTYGWTDPLAAVRHDEIVVGQPRWERFDVAASDYLLRVLFRSFWGQFGWMGVVLDERLYLLYLAVTLLGLGGLLLLLHERFRPSPGPGRTVGSSLSARGEPGQRPAVGLLVAATILAIGQVLAYNSRFIQPQGRYLFPALAPISLLLSLGWWRLAHLTAQRGWNLSTGHRLLFALGAGLGALDLVCLLVFVTPAFR